MKNIELYNGDCIKVMQDLIRQGIKVDLTVTSPPYDNLRTYNGTCEWSFDIFKQVAQCLYDITTEGGVVVWVVGDATIKGSETGTSFRQALYFKEIGFNLHDTMIWEKPTFTATGALKVRYAQVFEYMFIFSKGSVRTFNPIKDRINKTAGCKKKGTIRNVDGSMRQKSSIGKITQEYGTRFNVWRINTENSSLRKFHPAIFPEQLANDHIISWSNEGDLVLDCFMGSGTTGKMAVLNNRRFIGIEKVKEYFDISKRRIDNANNNKQLSLF